MLGKAYAIFAYLVPFFVATSGDPDPCLSGNHRNITHLFERYSKLKDACPYTDHRIERAWFYAGADAIVTFPPDYCACGYKFPIWLNGTLPSPSQGVVDRSACLKFLQPCHQALSIQMKNCGEYFVYHLTPGPDDSGYCFGIDKPTKPGEHTEQVPNATLAVEQDSVTSNSFFTEINVTSVNDGNVTAVLLQQGSLLQSVQIENTSLVYKWENLLPATNYTVQIYAYVTGNKRIIATVWALTKQLLPSEINVYLDVPSRSIASDRFTFVLKVTVGFDRGSLKVNITQSDGTVINEFDVVNPDSVFSVYDLMAATNYNIEVFTKFQDEIQIISTRWVMTEPYRKATALIEVQHATISKESLDITVTYEHGSEKLAAKGTMHLQNGNVVRSFHVDTPSSSLSFKNLTTGTKYSIDVYVSRRGERTVLDQVWVFTQPGIQAYLTSTQVGDLVSSYTTFRCEFVRLPEHSYNVRWTVQRPERNITIDKKGADVHEINDFALTEEDLLKKHVYIPFNVSCAVAENTATSSKTDLPVSSDNLFAGIKLLTPQLNMHRDETKVIKFIPAVPFGCYTAEDGTISCNLQMAVSIPVQRNCTGISTRTCSLEIQGDVDTKHNVQIQATEDGQYGVLQAQTYDVILRTAFLNKSIWSNYILPAVKVTVQPEQETYWRGRVCEALNDPHMYTFDAVPFEHHESLSDEYVMYAHASYHAKVHHKLERCNSNAMCNCGVAIQAGRDIYVISTCNNVLEIGYKQCDDGVLLVKQETDTTYSIYLPYGTYARARIDKSPYFNSVGGMIVSVTIYPSVHDQQGRSKGLCGTLDNNRTNDFHGPTGELNLNRTEFIQAWRVSKDASLFKPNVKSTAPWTNPACTCSLTSGEVHAKGKCRLGADSSCSKGKNVGEQTCKMAVKQQIESSGNKTVPTLDLNKDGNHQNSIPSKPTTTSTVRWDRPKANVFCTGYMDKSRTFRLCARVPYTDTERAVETCIQDIVLTQTTEWHRISRQSMQDSCLSEIRRNRTVREDLERPRQQVSTTSQHSHSTTATGSGHQMGRDTTPISNGGNKDSDLDLFEITKTIETIACPNECSDRGTCKNGTCECETGYGFDDCSIDLQKPPSTANLLHGTVCDEKDAECTHVFIDGGLFASESVRCHITTFETHAITKGRQNMDAYVLPGQAQSMIEVICPLRPARQKRSVPDIQDVKLISCYRVSVSNDGVHHGIPLEMCVYNSECQSLSNTEDGLLTAVVKEEFCFIDGKCIPSGMENPNANTYCEPQISLYRWAVRTASAFNPVTETTSEVVITHVDTKSSVMTPVIAAVVCVIVVCILVTLVVCIRKRKRRKTDSKQKEKENTTVSYKHDPDFDEETYAHINPIHVSDDFSHLKAPIPDESRIDDYTRLDTTRKEKVQYAKLNAADNIRLNGGPSLPDRCHRPRVNNRSQNWIGSNETPSDPYQRLNRSEQINNEYAKLKSYGEDYLSPTHELDFGHVKNPGQQKLYFDLNRGEVIPEGYERPDPKLYQSHYRY